jgi:adenosine kinase
MEIPEKYTASFFANTDLDNNQIASFYTGAMADACKVSLKKMNQCEADFVVISPNDPSAMDQYVNECIELSIPYLYDPSQQVARNDHSQLRRGVEGAYSLFCNEYEYELLQSHTGLSAKQIEEKVHLLVVTYGEKGAIVKTGNKEYQIPIVPADFIADPTGVGDAFRGGFLRGYRLGLDMQTCGQMGALAATYVLEQKGTQNHHYSIPEYIKRYRAHFDDLGALDKLLQ